MYVRRESDLTNRGYLQLAQEISYQWLGAYTTPTWWSDAHINKALVGYLAAETAFKVTYLDYWRVKGSVLQVKKLRHPHQCVVHPAEQ